MVEDFRKKGEKVQKIGDNRLNWIYLTIILSKNLSKKAKISKVFVDYVVQNKYNILC